MAGVQILVWVKHDFMKFCYGSMEFMILVSSLYSLHMVYVMYFPLNSCSIIIISMRRHYFQKSKD